MKEVKPIAFYLPQFHPIPENDRWWERGFTEWTNVTKAVPLFEGHDQPHLPADLGFYDLRLAETRELQAELARSYGIYGFCYYHYWFQGKRLLERPFNEVLNSGKPDFPFCLCWANEPWTRAWDGNSGEILMPQKYTPEDDLNHIRWLSQAFLDPRYIRVAGKPLLLVYNPGALLPDTAQRWRSEVQKFGIEDLYLAAVESFGQRGPASKFGFDAMVEFQPDQMILGIGEVKPLLNQPNHYLHVQSYPDLLEVSLARLQPPYVRLPCVAVGWDNTARRKHNSLIFTDATPQHYERWLTTIVQRIQQSPSQPELMFINAWNEWAEGAHLEPCQRWKRGYLEATQRALTSDHAQPLYIDTLREQYPFSELNMVALPDGSHEDGRAALFDAIQALVLGDRTVTISLFLVIPEKERALVQSALGELFELTKSVQPPLQVILFDEAGLRFRVLLTQMQVWLQLTPGRTDPALELYAQKSSLALLNLTT